MSVLINAVERGFIPDFAVRFGIRNLIKKRIEEITQDPMFHRETILKKLNDGDIVVLVIN